MKPLWESWSQYGRVEAAKILNRPVDAIAPTTNHLESFNGVLKHKHLRRFQRGGRKMRIDLLIYLLATRILPGVFQQRKVEEDFYCWLSMRFKEQGGSRDLVEEHLARRRASTKKAPSTSTEPNYEFTWWPTDSQSQHQEEALYIIRKRRISDFKWTDGFTITATCASSHVDIRVQGHMRYKLLLNCYGWGACSCPSFSKFGCACKHLWAFRMVAVQMRSHYSFIFPSTEETARSIYISLFSHISNDTLTEATVLPPLDPFGNQLGPPPLQNYAASICSEVQEIAEALETPKDLDSEAEEDSDTSGEQMPGSINYSEQNVWISLT